MPIGASCQVCGATVEDNKYTRPNPNRGFSQFPYYYCCKECYDKGKKKYKAEESNKASPSGAMGDIYEGVATWFLQKILPRIAPYLGWFGVVILPFIIKYRDSSMPIAAWIISAILGVGIGLAIKLIPLPQKLKKFEFLRKILLWLPFIVVAVILVIYIIKMFIRARAGM